MQEEEASTHKEKKEGLNNLKVVEFNGVRYYSMDWATPLFPSEEVRETFLKKIRDLQR
jgi:hypothetical protein